MNQKNSTFIFYKKERREYIYPIKRTQISYHSWWYISIYVLIVTLCSGYWVEYKFYTHKLSIWMINESCLTSRSVMTGPPIMHPFFLGAPMHPCNWPAIAGFPLYWWVGPTKYVKKEKSIFISWLQFRPLLS
jgi:hypothetical protein